MAKPTVKSLEKKVDALTEQLASLVGVVEKVAKTKTNGNNEKPTFEQLEEWVMDETEKIRSVITLSEMTRNGVTEPIFVFSTQHHPKDKKGNLIEDEWRNHKSSGKFTADPNAFIKVMKEAKKNHGL